jgi:hypothetical protein
MTDLELHPANLARLIRERRERVAYFKQRLSESSALVDKCCERAQARLEKLIKLKKTVS